MSQNIHDIFRSNGGVMKMSEVIASGISRHQLYQVRDAGVVEHISRGLYRLTDMPPASDPDLMVVAHRFPRAVICLVSALAFHDITTEIPRSISIAVHRNTRMPKLESPPIKVHRFSDSAFHAGIKEHSIDGAWIKIYSPEKTLADCFKFRNKIGMDVVLEALKLYRSRKHFDVDALLKYARICRVENVMYPYLEAQL